MGFAAKLLLSLIGAVALSAVASQVQAADARPCQRLNAALNDDQRKKTTAWLHQEFPGTDFSLDYSCKVDAKRVAIAVVDFGGLQSAVYLLDVSGDSAQPRKLLDGGVHFCSNAYEALEGADALVIVTEWNEFRHPDFGRIKSLLKSPVIFDGRNIYNPVQLRGLGFTYFGIGRTPKLA